MSFKTPTDAVTRDAVQYGYPRSLLDIMDRLGPAVFVGLLDLDGKLKYANRAALETAGVSAEAVLGLPFDRTPWWAGSETARQRLRAAIQDAARGVASRYDTQIVDAAGKALLIDFSLEPVIGAAAGENYLVASASDVTDRRRAERTLRATQAAVDRAHEALFQVDAFGALQYANDSGCQLLGYSREQLLDLHVWDLDADMSAADWPKWWHEAKSNGSLRAQRYVLHRAGHRIPVIVAAHYIEHSDGDGSYVHLIDLSERAASEERIRRMARYDSGTGLPNRRLLRESLEARLGRFTARDWRHGLLLIGLDRFKLISDSFGEDMADRVLEEVAQRLLQCFDPATVIARIGADEFAVILEGENADPQGGSALAQRVLDALSRPVRAGDEDVYIKCSVALARSDDTGAEQLIANAFVALNDARKRGDGMLQTFKPRPRDTSRDRLRLEADLYRATRQGEFRLHYQPRVSARTGTLQRFEALLRWQRSDGWIPPARFIPIAEEVGLILPIGEWALRRALKEASTWATQLDGDFGVSVNLSARQFRQADLVDCVSRALRDNAIDPTMLELELTESMLIDDVQEAIAIMRGLKDLGVRLSLDDFGTGFSSLSYLRRFPIDNLKIDKSFVHGVDADDTSEAIIDTVINMAHRLHLSVTAEGVETARQLELLRNKGCDEAQGYFIAAPMSAGEALSFSRVRAYQPGPKAKL